MEAKEPSYELFIHAIYTVYENQPTEVVFLVGGSRVFNSINKYVFIHNVPIICHTIETCVSNYYSVNNLLFIVGGGKIQSVEEIT